MLSVGQVPRAAPLTPAAVLGFGESARALARRLLELTDVQLARLRGVVGDDTLLVLGSADELPWSDGVSYLGREPSAPELYLPCAAAPDVPAPLLLRALIRRFESHRLVTPVVVSFEPAVVLSVVAAQELRRAQIIAWLAAGKAQ